MRPTNRSSKRREKLNYLDGILTGWNSIYEIIDHHPSYLFMETEVDGIYYRAKDISLKPVEGDTRRYTVEQINKIRKIPKVFVLQGRFGKKKDKDDTLQ